MERVYFFNGCDARLAAVLGVWGEWEFSGGMR